jgi:hypothetical protein
MMARLTTLFATQGTTVELCWGNSLRNIFYYENKVCAFAAIHASMHTSPTDRPFTRTTHTHTRIQMEKLIIPAGESNPQRFATIQEVCAKLQSAQKTSFDVVRGGTDGREVKALVTSFDRTMSTPSLINIKRTRADPVPRRL